MSNIDSRETIRIKIHHVSDVTRGLTGNTYNQGLTLIAVAPRKSTKAHWKNTTFQLIVFSNKKEVLEDAGGMEIAFPVS